MRSGAYLREKREGAAENMAATARANVNMSAAGRRQAVWRGIWLAMSDGLKNGGRHARRAPPPGAHAGVSASAAALAQRLGAARGGAGRQLLRRDNRPHATMAGGGGCSRLVGGDISWRYAGNGKCRMSSHGAIELGLFGLGIPAAYFPFARSRRIDENKARRRGGAWRAGVENLFGIIGKKSLMPAANARAYA